MFMPLIYRKRGLWVTIAIIAVVLILAAVGGILGAVLGRKDTDDVLAATAPTDVPTTDPPTPLPTSPRFDQIASLVEGYFGTVLEDPLSPQYRAAEWLADVDTTFDPTDEARFRQRYSIVVFYYATGGATWASQTNFLLPGVHECNWTEPAPVGSPLSFENLGVAVCGEQDHILAIQMGQNNLTGYLPEEIGALTRLALISIIDDNLEGPLPSSLFELRDLTILAVPFNNFTGTIPTSIGQLTQLLSIWFQDATFESPIPSEIGLLTDLTHITMATCSLHGSIPESMKMLSNLESLTLSDNELTGTLSDSFPASWPNLSLLNLAYNNLNGSIPQNIGEMSKLQGIGLNNNYQLTGSFPDSLANLPLLEVLYVDNNLLTGSLPNYWSGSTMLSELSIFNNLLTGSLPPSLGELMALRHLNLGYNGNGGVGLNGTLPTELGNATNLRYLALDWNDFTGTVPQIFKNLTFLSKFSQAALLSFAHCAPSVLTFLFSCFLSNRAPFVAMESTVW
jgi:Leucine-rich repeat (LRR) protein